MKLKILNGWVRCARRHVMKQNLFIVKRVLVPIIIKNINDHDVTLY